MSTPGSAGRDPMGGSGSGAAAPSSSTGTRAGALSRPPSAPGVGRPPLRSDTTRPVSSIGTARSLSRANSSVASTPAHGSQADALASPALAAAGARGTQDAAAAAAAAAAAVPVHSTVYTQSNALFDAADTSMTPSVRVREYSPSLLAGFGPPGALAGGHPSTAHAGVGTPPAAQAPAAAGVAGLQRLPQPQQQKQQQQPERSSPAKPHLPTAGDLFTPPDPAYSDAGLQRDVCGTKVTVPAWNYSRPFLAGTFILDQALLDLECSQDPPPSLQGLPTAVQEQALVNDLLHTFCGVPGKYIRAQLVSGGGGGSGGVFPSLAFHVAVPLEPCLLEQVGRLLPLSECVATIQRFIETRSWSEHPLVVQALAASMRGLLQQWLLMVTQLEHQMRCGRMSLQALLYHCQQPMASLRLLAGIAVEAASSCMSSATLLNQLSAKAASLAGDRGAQQLVQKLLDAAAAPYFAMLELWLTTGELDDPYKEFMVEGDRTITKDTLTDDQQLAYWQHRYVLRRDVMREPPEGHAQQRVGGRLVWQAPLDVPEFLAPAADAILAAGKHLNAIRACGKPLPSPLATGAGALRYDPAGAYVAAVQSAHARASAALMQVMMQEVDVAGWLTSLKHFFLLDQGDLLVHLLAFAQDELSCPSTSINRARLQSLLELAVRSSSCAGDAHVDNLGYTFDPRSLADLAMAVQQQQPAASVLAGKTQRMQQRDKEAGWQVLLFTFQVEWPVSLLVGRPQLLQYQLLFKHLFTLRFMERQLNGVWLQLQQTRRMDRDTQKAFKPWHQLCSRVTFLVTEVLRYVTIDVLEPLWATMSSAVREAVSIDEVMSCHQRFLDRAVEGALLDVMPVAHKMDEVAMVARDLWWAAQVLQPSAQAQAQQQGPGPAAPGAAARGAAGAKPVRLSSFAQTQQLLRQVAADQDAGAAVAALQRRFHDKSRALLRAMRDHYQQLLAGPSSAEEGPGGRVAAAGGVRRLWGREELESLADLLERLDVDQQHLSPAAKMALALQGGGDAS